MKRGKVVKKVRVGKPEADNDDRIKKELHEQQMQTNPVYAAIHTIGQCFDMLKVHDIAALHAREGQSLITLLSQNPQLPMTNPTEYRAFLINSKVLNLGADFVNKFVQAYSELEASKKEAAKTEDIE